jgi:hypothetical protein
MSLSHVRHSERHSALEGEDDYVAKTATRLAEKGEARSWGKPGNLETWKPGNLGIVLSLLPKWGSRIALDIEPLGWSNG